MRLRCVQVRAAFLRRFFSLPLNENSCHFRRYTALFSLDWLRKKLYF